MSNISELGNRILAVQSELGLENPKFYRTGMADLELNNLELFMDLPPKSELRDFFAWRNGCLIEGVPMSKLWLKPGFYPFSASESVLSNRYCSDNLPDWSRSWYPLLSDGAAGMCFCDIKRISDGRLPVFDYDPESNQVINQIYDNIETMFTTVLECYERRIYFLKDGLLSADFPREVDLSVRLNPKSELWSHNDLFKS